MKFSGIESSGTLIEFVSQTTHYDSATLSPVGVVLLDDGTFQSVPLEFLHTE